MISATEKITMNNTENLGYSRAFKIESSRLKKYFKFSDFDRCNQIRCQEGEKIIIRTLNLGGDI